MSSSKTVRLTRAELKDITNKTFQFLAAEKQLKPKRSVLRDHVAQLLAKRQWSSLLSDWPENQTRAFAMPRRVREEWDFDDVGCMSTKIAVDTLEVFAGLPEQCKKYESVPPALMKQYIWANYNAEPDYYEGFFLSDAIEDDDWEQFYQGLNHWPLVLNYEGEAWLVMEIFQLYGEQKVLIAPDIACGHYAMRLNDFLEFQSRYLTKHTTGLDKWQEQEFNIEAMRLLVNYSAQISR